MRVYINKGIMILLGFSLFWTLSLFIAPFTIPPHTVENLTGGTAVTDFEDHWAKMNFFARVIYSIGDSQCHQLGHRSFYLNGNQMPVCSRCMALFLWANMGAITAMLLQPRYDISKAAVDIYPKKLKKFIQDRRLEFPAWIALAVLCILPTGIDGFYQLLTPYESTNLNRLIFSIPTGWFGGFATGLMVNTVYYNIFSPDDVAPYAPPKTEPPKGTVAKAGTDRQHHADKEKKDGPPDKGPKEQTDAAQRADKKSDV